MTLLHLIPLVSLAVIQAPEQRTIPVQGIVTDIRNGDPLPSVQIQMTGKVTGEPRDRTFTDFTGTDGRFSLRVPPADYDVVVLRPGYFGPPRFSYLQATINLKLNLSDGQAPPEQLFSLTPAGVVTGRIFDESGRPAAGLPVTLNRTSYEAGKPYLNSSRSAETNALGEYRIYWVLPGDYLVTAERASSWGQALISGQGSSTPIRTFYPGTTQIESARMVSVSPGAEVTAIDFGIRTPPSFKASGRVINPFVPPGGPPPGTAALPTLTLMSRDESVKAFFLPLPQDPASLKDRQAGLFEFRGVPAGHYDLVAQVNDAGNLTYWGLVTIDLLSRDLNDIEVKLRPTIEIRGQVTTRGTAGLPQNVSVGLGHQGPPLGVGSSRVDADPNGEFTIKGLIEGSYRVMAFPYPDTFYVADLRQGDRSIYNDGVVQIGGDATGSLQVVVDSNPAKITGSVTHPNGKKGVDTTVTVMPESSLRANLSLYRSALVDESGRFTLINLAPGSYKLVAFEGAPPWPWSDPQFLEKYENAGIEVTATAGETTDVQVPVIWLSSQN